MKRLLIFIFLIIFDIHTTSIFPSFSFHLSFPLFHKMPSEESIIIGPPENIIDWCPATQNAWFVYLNLLTTIYAILHWVLYEMWKFYQANKNHRFIFRYLFGMVMLFIGEVAQLYSLGDWTSQPSRVVRDLGYIMFCGFLDDNLFAWTSIPIGLSYLISYLVLGVVPNGLCDFFFYFCNRASF